MAATSAPTPVAARRLRKPKAPLQLSDLTATYPSSVTDGINQATLHGASLLDIVHGSHDWDRHVNLNTLNLEDPRACVLGQEFDIDTGLPSLNRMPIGRKLMANHRNSYGRNWRRTWAGNNYNYGIDALTHWADMNPTKLAAVDGDFMPHRYGFATCGASIIVEYHDLDCEDGTTCPTRGVSWARLNMDWHTLIIRRIAYRISNGQF